MPNTPLLKECLLKIASLNDQLWYYFFLSENLNFDLAGFSKKAKESFTTDLFSNNRYSKKIHVRIEEIPRFQNENKNLTCGAYFSTCYEILSKYIDECLIFLGSCNMLNTKYGKAEDPEANLNKMLLSLSLNPLDAKIVDTLKYLRLRRNHYTHISANPSPYMQKFLDDRAVFLQTSWYGDEKNARLDFSKPLVRDFSEEETIELLKISAILCKLFDEFIMSKIQHDELVRYLFNREYANSKTRANIDVKKLRLKKIKSLGMREFGILFKEETIESSINNNKSL